MIELFGFKIIHIISGVSGAVVAILVDKNLHWRDILAILIV